MLLQKLRYRESGALPGFGVILIIVVVLLTGVSSRTSSDVSVSSAFWESLMDRIPLVRSIYSAAKNFAEIVFSDSSQAFKQVLLIEYPRKGLYSLCVPDHRPNSARSRRGRARTSSAASCRRRPNPTSGFIIMVPKKDVGCWTWRSTRR